MKIAEVCVACGSNHLQRNPAVLMPFVAERAFGWKPCAVSGLRDIPDGMAYAVCTTLRCGQCGLVFCDIRFNDDEMRRIYKNYRGAEYTSLREQYEPGYAVRNQRLIEENHKPLVEDYLAAVQPESVLDFGGDDGTKTPFSDSAMVVDVYDIGGKDVLKGTQVYSLRHAYDLIVCAHVLEHVPQPLEILERIQTAMHDRSILYIEVPLEYLGEKRHWHEHINLFSKTALYRLLERCALKVIDYRTVTLNGLNIQMLMARRIL